MGPTKNATCLLPLDQRFKTVEAVEMSQLFGLCLSVSAVPSFIVHFCCRQQNKKLVVVEKNCVAKKWVCVLFLHSLSKNWTQKQENWWKEQTLELWNQLFASIICSLFSHCFLLFI
jgi:hypothetical protein